MTKLSKLGYRTARVSASGQSKGKRRLENLIPADIIAWAPLDSTLPHMILEIGGTSKRLGIVFSTMLSTPLPSGHIAVLAKCVGRKWTYYSDPDSRFDSLEELLESEA